MKFKGRYIFIGLAFLVVVSGLTWRVVNLHVFEKGFLQDQGDRRTVRVVGTPAHRGMILDRNGEPLAISTPVNSVWLNPKEFNLEDPQLLALAAALDISLDQLRNKALLNSGKEFVYLQRHVSPNVAEEIKRLEITGVHLKPEYRRFYPAGEVAAHVVGFTDLDDQGKEGLELVLENSLAGAKGRKKVVKDRQGHEVKILEDLQEMQSGQDVVLSVDQRLQYLAYRELKAAVASSKAKAGSAVVLDVQTGEILAMVNQPSFNPNIRIKPEDTARCRNRAVTDKFEPGSVMKTFSVVNAMQHSHVTPNTLINTSPGRLMIGKNVVREIDDKDLGILSVARVLETSSNIGVAKLTLSLPAKNLVDTYSRFGFGTTTGSGFPGESAGTLHAPPKDGSFVLATMAFGYAMSVTPLQLAQAFAILGAGGVKRTPTFLKQSDIPTGEEIVDHILAQKTMDMLLGIVEEGGGAKAKVVGYHTAGKTGTARKLAAGGGYNKHAHVAVFAGLAPASHPRFAIVVVVDDPTAGLYYGSQVAAPLFSKIAAGALRLFNVPPDMVDNQKLRVAQANKNALHVDYE
ncbi:MAG TPA: penicillin-binding transpeptidase domain-containing protein [Gammaproteobacteria bacterium]|nr:penicillin-binding transpeptidase domain-containing protein [Gammaproteobacteria bacterium]